MMMGGPTSLMIFTILSIPLYIILGAIFGAVGGMLYGKLMK